MYSASVVDNAVIVCILNAQVMGAPTKTYIPTTTLLVCHRINVGILLAPNTCEVSVDSTIKVPLLVWGDN